MPNVSDTVDLFVGPSRWVTVCLGILMGGCAHGASIGAAIAQSHWLQAGASTAVTLLAIGLLHKALQTMLSLREPVDRPIRSAIFAMRWAMLVVVLFSLPMLWTPVVFANCFPWMV